MLDEYGMYIARSQVHRVDLQVTLIKKRLLIACLRPALSSQSTVFRCRFVRLRAVLISTSASGEIISKESCVCPIVHCSVHSPQRVIGHASGCTRHRDGAAYLSPRKIAPGNNAKTLERTLEATVVLLALHTSQSANARPVK